MPSSSDATNDAHDGDGARDRDHTPRRLRKRERLEQIAAALHHTEPLLPAGGTGPAVLMEFIAASSKMPASADASAQPLRGVVSATGDGNGTSRVGAGRASAWPRAAASGSASEDFVRKLGTSVAPHEKA